MRTPLLLLGILLLPRPVQAQHGAFHALLDGYITYRPTAAWQVVQAIHASGVEGAVLTPLSAADSDVSALLLAYRAPTPGTFRSFGDSLLALLAPGQNPTRTWDGGTDTTRVVIWTADSPAGRLIAIDRLLLLADAVLLARVAMPAAPPADRDQIPVRLQAIDDLLTSVHAEGRLLFPAGAGLALRVY